MAGPIKIGGKMGSWTVKALEKDGSAPRYSAELNGQKGTLTYYPLMGPRTLMHQTLGARLKRCDKLSHESLVKVEAGRAGGSDGFFIVVPNLEKVHKLGKPPLQPMDALNVLRAAADALSVFEAKGIPHGELDAWCMVKKDDGTYAILPPGLRVPPPGVDRLGLEIDPSYAAPEVLDGSSATLVSDFFSLGLILYRLVTGKRPVNAKEPSSIFAERGKIPAPSMAQASVPGPLKALYSKLVAHDARQRPQSIQELMNDIELATRGKKSVLNIPKVPVLEPDRIGGSVGILVFLLLAAGGLFYTATSVFAVSNPLEGLPFPLKGEGYAATAPITTDTDGGGTNKGDDGAGTSEDPNGGTDEDPKKGSDSGSGTDEDPKKDPDGGTDEDPKDPDEDPVVPPDGATDGATDGEPDGEPDDGADSSG